MLAEADPSPALTEYFADLDDPRRENSTDYPLHEIIVLTICGVICGADESGSIANFGEAKKEWLGQFLELENGIPSHDTIGRFFGLLDPEAFEARFSRWVREACEHVDGEVVAVDGKTLRRSYDRDSSKAAVHMEGSRSYGQRLGERKRDDPRAGQNGGQVQRNRSPMKSRPSPSYWRFWT
ncbi:ISAs1 family transposase [Salinibacter ruber]|uniref:ISAs1 family transposase n=1 Tax=Salinibacter ruber TaxID=146919 RepID=UPI002073CE88|nr:ISAs1 family transposase [Salinibacter ruber]